MTVLDCHTCGVCCAGSYADADHADCTVTDVIRMSRAVRTKLVNNWRSFGVRPGESGATATDGEGRCVFLRGVIGRRTSCRIYATRPTVCREFRPGSRRCKAARKAAGMPPP